MAQRQLQGLSDLAGRIILASMGDVRTRLSVVREGRVWRVKIVWPNGAKHYFGKFTSEQDAVDWINAHPRLTKPEDTIDDRKVRIGRADFATNSGDAPSILILPSSWLR
jgi:hypothetical protein